MALGSSRMGREMGVPCPWPLLSDSTSYASATSLNFLSANSLLSGFLSGCHCRAFFRYLQEVVSEGWVRGQKQALPTMEQNGPFRPLVRHRPFPTQIVSTPAARGRLCCHVLRSPSLSPSPLQPVLGAVVAADDHVSLRKPQS